MKFAVTLVVVVGFALPASADSRTKMFPLGGTAVPKSLKGAPGELSHVLARSLGAELTTVPIEDAAELMECSLTQRPCLEAIARSVNVSTIVFGKLDMRGDDTEVEVTTFEAGKGETTKTYTISGDTVDALATSLRDALEIRKPALPPRIPVTPTATEESSGGVTSGTWGMLLGGGVAIGAGLAFMASANGIRKQVDKAPTTTRDDIDRLITLEKAGKSRMQVGGALMAVGGVVATIGIVRMIVQKSSRTERMIDVVPEKGGASVFLTVRR